MLNNDDFEWNALIRGTLYYTGDGKMHQYQLTEKKGNKLVNCGEAMQVST